MVHFWVGVPWDSHPEKVKGGKSTHRFLLIQAKGNIQVQKTVKETHPGQNKEIQKHKQYCNQNQSGPHPTAVTWHTENRVTIFQKYRMCLEDKWKQAPKIHNTSSEQEEAFMFRPYQWWQEFNPKTIKKRQAIPYSQNWYFNVLFYTGDFETLYKIVPLTYILPHLFQAHSFGKESSQGQSLLGTTYYKWVGRLEPIV